MPVIQQKALVPANGIIDNVLTGSQYEYLPWNASIEFGVNGGAEGGDLQADVYSGSDVLMEDGLLSAQNRIPIYPDDYQLTDVAAAGERLKIRVRETAGTATTIFYSVRITPL